MGDVIQVQKDTEFPADLLLLTAPKEIVYVDTMNLDGETNLKEKYLFDKTIEPSSLSNFSGHIICDMPNENLDEWDGNVSFGSTLLNCK